MILLSAKARRLVESAVRRLPTPSDRLAWEEWSRSHEATKQWDTPLSEHVVPMPAHVVAIASSALSSLAESLQRQVLSEALDEDELVQLDNNLEYIRAIERTLAQTTH